LTRIAPLTLFLAALLCLAILAHVLLGPTSLDLPDELAALAGGGSEIARAIIIEVRLPRALMAALVGAALALSGAGLQGLLRNPLADPGILGISGFASLGAVLAFSTGLAATAPLAAPALALAFAGVAAAAMVALAWRVEGAGVLILIGVGLSSFSSGLVALALNLARSPAALSDLVNWTLGAVANRGLEDVALASAPIALGGACLLAAGPGLRALTLGEEGAAAIGADVRRTRALVVLGAALAAGAAAAFAGAIGFVGVASAHLVRKACGGDPARILAPSALVGASILVVADLLVRLLPTQQELRLGVAAALIGGPAFALIAVRLWRRS
jgi:iron complex transport system permease protein